ncbi:hypothetical protein KFK09_026370 [Dendrobium nobile]|uniref:Uncharacterized protein n=1 Tax=Dendrobium nobile TaxID=94219 RepID=A0A8T3ACQ1_DENNO|nr:hypothetical protein KFK09_026370 [Dendrobium nobile]
MAKSSVLLSFSCHFSPKLSTIALLIIIIVKLAGLSSAARSELGLPSTHITRPAFNFQRGSLLTLSLLAKGSIPPSGPSMKGHSSPDFRRHLRQVVSSSGKLGSIHVGYS